MYAFIIRRGIGSSSVKRLIG